jgi:phosphomevalonate kinase
VIELTASAPGKLVLLGEYAVLEGAPALAVAVDRRAMARVAARNDNVCEVNAPDLGVVGARLVIDPDGDLRWQCTKAEAAKLRLIDHVWQHLLQKGLAPRARQGFSLHLDTSDFFAANGAGQAKLGLGSSAALTVALATALSAFAGDKSVMVDRAQWLHCLLQMHGSWQDGHGSGVDVATSVAGGLIAYRLEGPEREPSLAPMDWPIAGVHCLFVWSGHAVSTADFLRRLAQWRLDHGAAYATHMRDLSKLAETAVDALRQGNGVDFVMIVAAYASALEHFGTECGLEIFSAEQKRLAELSARIGVSYKPCGAGGDFGVVFTTDEDRVTEIERSIIAEGLRGVPLKVDSRGAHYAKCFT